MIQLGIILCYFLATILIGVAANRRTDSVERFEGYQLGLLMCVAISAGEWMGGSSTTGVSEYGYLFGISGAWYTVANGLGICFLGLFFARMFRRLNTSTVPEIIGRYLGGKARVVSSLLLTLVLAIVGTSQMIAIGTLGQSLLGLDAGLSILILGGGVLLYTCLGGSRAIGFTNLIHMIIMYLGIIAALAVCAATHGGADALREALPASYFSPVAIGPNRVISWIIASVLGACTAQAGLQPILRSRDEQTATRASFLIALIVAPFGILTALLGMYARMLFPALESAKLALPTLLMTLNPWISGLVMAAIVAAVLSTASPIFLACGTLVTRDLYSVLPHDRPPDAARLLRVSRLATLGAGAACLLAAVLLSESSTILDVVYFAYSLRGSLFVILLLGIFWKRMTPRAAVIAMLLTAAVGLYWVIFHKITGAYPIPGVTETYAAIFVSLAGGAGVSLLVPSAPDLPS